MNLNYQPLLDTIASGESHGNYNAYFGNGGNAAIKFTEMKVGDVLAWQREFVNSGQPSNAVGKYQFIEPTLSGLVQKYNISQDRLFDAQLQDELAVKLLEKRGIKEYAHGKISREQFAHNLSQEWAALPMTTGTNPEKSYYSGDGLNASHISVEQILSAIDKLAPPI